MTRITRSTIKSFINKNKEDLYVMKKSDFNGMTDGVEYFENPELLPVVVDIENANMPEHTLGVPGLWLVGSSRDYFSPFSNEKYEGYEVYNSCGSCIIATRKKRSIYSLSPEGNY